jgi:hypothetical protein
MYNQGQLVQPNADGSRPGYRGKKDVDRISAIKNYIKDQGKVIDGYEFKEFLSELGYKKPRDIVKGLEKGGMFKEDMLGKKTITKTERPKTRGLFYSKGQTTTLNKYAELLNKQEPKKYTSSIWKELGDLERANILNRARLNDWKFKATTMWDPLTPKQQQNIIEAFDLPEDAFDYDPNKQKNVKGATKYGVSRDNKKYHQIYRYVKDGFKFPPKDMLPVAKQRDIIARFELPEGFEDWDFKKYKYGIPSGGSASNPAYTKRIIDFTQGKTRFPNLAADAGTPQGWMMNQYYRTYTYEKERNVPRNKLTYKPIFETINGKQKVVGFVDNTVSGNGKTYFGIKKWNDKYNGNLLDTHFDFKNVKKFVDISKKAYEEPNEVIKGLLKKGGVQPTEKLQLKHILNFLAEKNGYKATESAIKIHHQSGVGAGGVSGEAVKDLQLLKSEVNSSIRQAETRIRNAVVNNLTPNVDDVNKLKSLGASIKVGGKIYGGGSQTAIGSFKEIEKQAISEIKDFNKKDFKQLAGYLEKLGCGRAAGGRILFSNGTPGASLTECGKKGVARFIDDLKKGNYSKASLNILKGGGNLIKNIVNPMELLKLRNLIGPGAMGFMAAFEAGVITDDVIRQGTPLNESLANNWLTRSFLPYTKQYAEAKNLLETGKVPSNMKKYVQDVVTFNDMLMDMKGIEGRKDSRLVDDSFGMIDGTSMYTKEQEQKEDEALMKKAKTLTENVFTPGSAKALEMRSLQDENEATRMAKPKSVNILGKNFQYSDGFSSIFGLPKLKDVRTPGSTSFDYIPEETPKDLRPITYKDYEKTELPAAERQYYENTLNIKPRSSLSEYSFPGSDINALEELTRRYNMREAAKYPGFFSADSEKFSEGGITALRSKYEYKK